MTGRQSAVRRFGVRARKVRVRVQEHGQTHTDQGALQAGSLTAWLEQALGCVGNTAVTRARRTQKGSSRLPG
jgi:acyl-coenzyme A thioesterase PaaI-like protein